jgi:hypothetical protein
MKNALYVLAVILILLWVLGGFAYHIGGALIHLLLVAAIVVVVVNAQLNPPHPVRSAQLNS